MIYVNDWKNFEETGIILGGLSYYQLKELIKQKKLELGIYKEDDVLARIYITHESIDKYINQQKQQQDI